MPDPDARTAALKQARMLFSMIAAPKLRAPLGQRLQGSGEESVPEPIGPRPDWISQDGTVDVAAVRAVKDELEAMLSPEALLGMPRIEQPPAEGQEELSHRILQLVHARLDPRGAIAEAELNAAIAMFTPDVAGVRRAGVDAGILERSADGARYSFVVNTG